MIIRSENDLIARKLFLKVCSSKENKIGHIVKIYREIPLVTNLSMFSDEDITRKLLDAKDKSFTGADGVTWKIVRNEDVRGDWVTLLKNDERIMKYEITRSNSGKTIYLNGR